MKTVSVEKIKRLLKSAEELKEEMGFDQDSRYYYSGAIFACKKLLGVDKKKEVK
jgi:hypothetical protein